MTEAELVTVIEWIEDRYGSNPRWRKTHAVVSDFYPYTLGAAMEAATDLYREGRPRINPSDLIGPTARAWRNRVEAGIDPQPERAVCRKHIWALPRDYELTMDLAGESMAFDECASCQTTRPTGLVPDA